MRDHKPRSTHTLAVRLTHWVVTISFLTLAFTGVMILMVHPRLYWGEAGNDLMQPLIELPISRNYKHGGWAGEMQLTQGPSASISAGRTYEIFNKNGWGRSLHFLAGWFLVFAGAVYLVAGVFSGHFGKQLFPRRSEFSRSNIKSELLDHLALRIPPASGGPDYRLFQKLTYAAIIFVALPLTFISGMTMSPAVVASFPFLLDIFGGHQSARTIHFFAFVGLVAFLFVHILMVVLSGPRKQLRGMTFGVKNDEKG